LASNSLSEAIVFGRRITEQIKLLEAVTKMPELNMEATRQEHLKQPIVEKRLKLQKIMLRYAGLKRTAKGLEKGLDELMRQVQIYDASLTKREEYEFANLLTCAMLTMQAALIREESRGGHFREDFPVQDDLLWRKHILFTREQGVFTEECAKDV